MVAPALNSYLNKVLILSYPYITLLVLSSFPFPSRPCSLPPSLWRIHSFSVVPCSTPAELLSMPERPISKSWLTAPCSGRNTSVFTEPCFFRCGRLSVAERSRSRSPGGGRCASALAYRATNGASAKDKQNQVDVCALERVRETQTTHDVSQISAVTTVMLQSEPCASRPGTFALSVWL